MMQVTTSTQVRMFMDVMIVGRVPDRGVTKTEHRTAAGDLELEERHTAMPQAQAQCEHQSL
jgi:hypothetical protein